MRATVFGRFETGLGVMRSLGLARIDFFSVDFKRDIGWACRYGEKLICPHPNEEQELKSWIKDNFATAERTFVFISSDDFLKFFAENRDFVSRFFVIEMAEKSLLDSLQDKFFQYESCVKNDVGSPWTKHYSSDLSKNDLEFPCFIKGLDVNLWRKHFGGTLKGFVVNNEDEYDKITSTFPFASVPAIIQELVVGPDENHFKYCAYRTKEGEVLVEFMLQKILQYPKGYGVGAAVKSVYHEDLREEGRKLFEGLKYVGVGSAEFKYDNVEKRYKLIELNPRYWQQNFLATACGLNFPIIQLRHAQDILNENSTFRYKENVLWMNRILVLRSLMSYIKEGPKSFIKRLILLKGKKIYSHQFSCDLGPFVSEMKWGLIFVKLPVVLIKDLLSNEKHIE